MPIEVTPSPTVTVLIDDRYEYHGIFEEEEYQLVISPVPLTVNIPVSVFKVHVNLVPQLPETVAALTGSIPVGNAANSNTTHRMTEIVFFINIALLFML